MFETFLTVIGNVVNEPVSRTAGDRQVIKLRVASNSRRRTADGGWEQGNTLFVNVNCWGRLATGVGASLAKGSPVIAAGHVHTSEYLDRDGVRRSALEMRATSVGPDLSRCVAQVSKLIPIRSSSDAAGPATHDAGAPAGSAYAADPDENVETDGAGDLGEGGGDDGSDDADDTDDADEPVGNGPADALSA